MTTTSSDPKSILGHFAAGATPAAAAVILLLWHALKPILVPQRQGFIFITAGALIAISLGVWFWCVVHNAANPITARNETADERQQMILSQIADNHAEITRELHQLGRAVQAAHKRLEALEKRLGAAENQRTEITAEVEHLRNLILQQGNLETFGQERLGPRPLR